MKRFKQILVILGALVLALGIYFGLSSEYALVTHPKGLIAHKELHLIQTIYLLGALIIIPTFIALFFVIWKYRANGKAKEYEPETNYGPFVELLPWIFPILIIAILAPLTVKWVHELDPYKPIASDEKPIPIQVIAIDWKWLFIYPEQGIAAVNFVQFPAGIPIHLTLAADESPMNSFWLPELSGQIYTMAGMKTQLHLMADGPGVYTGRAAEINGRGYADMTFVAKSTSQSEFEEWIDQVKQSPLRLTRDVYAELIKPSVKHPIVLYSFVENDLFEQAVMKYMAPP